MHGYTLQRRCVALWNHQLESSNGLQLAMHSENREGSTQSMRATESTLALREICALPPILKYNTKTSLEQLGNTMYRYTLQGRNAMQQQIKKLNKLLSFILYFFVLLRSDVSNWMLKIRSERGSNVIIILVGNKSDEVAKRQVIYIMAWIFTHFTPRPKTFRFSQCRTWAQGGLLLKKANYIVSGRCWRFKQPFTLNSTSFLKGYAILRCKRVLMKLLKHKPQGYRGSPSKGPL